MKKEVLNNSFVFYATNLEVIETLEETDKELANNFMKAIIEYGIYGEYENTNPIIKVLMVQAGFGIDKAKDRYATAVENGKKGGRPKTVDEDKVRELKGQGLTNKQIAEELKCSVSSVEKINAKNRKNRKNLNDNVNVNVNDNENVNINENEKKTFGLQANQNSEDADGTISECGAQSENVYNIKEINNNNKKEIDIGDFTPVRKNELPTPQMRNTNSAKTNLKVRKNDIEIDNINNIDIIDKDFLPTEEILDGFAIEPVKQESINQNNEAAAESIKETVDFVGDRFDLIIYTRKKYPLIDKEYKQAVSNKVGLTEEQIQQILKQTYANAGYQLNWKITA